MVDSLVNTGKKYGMEINSAKSKVMMVSKDSKVLKIVVDGRPLEQIDRFKYLGSTITSDAGCTKAIRIRIAMGKPAFNKKKVLLTSKLNLELKKNWLRVMCGVLHCMGQKRGRSEKRTGNIWEALKCGVREKWRR